MSLHWIDPLANEWCDQRLVGLFWERRHRVHVIFDGWTYRRSHYEPLVAEVMDIVIADPRIDGGHDGERLLPTHWLLIDVAEGHAFVLRADVAWESVIAQKPIGWVPPDDLWFPFKDDETEGQ